MLTVVLGLFIYIRFLMIMANMVEFWTMAYWAISSMKRLSAGGYSLEGMNNRRNEYIAALPTVGRHDFQ